MVGIRQAMPLACCAMQADTEHGGEVSARESPDSQSLDS